MGGDDKGCASRLSERTEEIGTHASNITNVITDVVSDGAWVVGAVLLETFADLASKVSTDISSLSVNTTANATEKCNGRATEAVASDNFEKSANFACNIFIISAERLGQDSPAVPDDEELENENCEADEAEAEDFTSLESDMEAFVDARVAGPGRSNIGKCSNAHADVATEHGVCGTNEEGEGGERHVASLTHGLLVIDGEVDEDGKWDAENRQVSVFFLEELVGAGPDQL